MWEKLKTAATMSIACSLLLTGCMNEPTVISGPSPESTDSSGSIEQEFQEVPEKNTPDVTIPACEELVPIETVHASIGEAFVFAPDYLQARDSHRREMGPAATTAFDQEEKSLFCVWMIPDSEGITTVWVSDMHDQVRDIFIDELRASDFVETESDGAPTFALEYERRVGASFIWYGFAENLVVSSTAFDQNGSLGLVALESLQATD